MKSITDTVRSILKHDEVAREAARRGILNSSAYAREITPTVAEETWKEVEESSVSVSINRIIQEQVFEPVKPDLVFEKVTVETGLVDVTYERTLDVKQTLNSILPSLRQKFPHDLFIETSGQQQLTMIMTQRMWDALREKITQKPVGLYENQVAIAISFDPSYLDVPNFIYGVLGILAVEKVNLMEIVSTMTEIVLIIDSSYLEVALTQVKKYLR
ncbi:MAG TPA: hypothetical protein VF209_05245 [Patescibacteria group bacterium]